MWPLPDRKDRGNRMKRSIALGFALVMAAAGSSLAVAQASPWPWFPEEPQGIYTQTWHDGFRAGGVAANRDITAKLLPELNRHPEYRKPDLSPIAAGDFRDGFRFAYQAVVDLRLHRIANPNSVAYGWEPPE